MTDPEGLRDHGDHEAVLVSKGRLEKEHPEQMALTDQQDGKGHRDHKDQQVPLVVHRANPEWMQKVKLGLRDRLDLRDRQDNRVHQGHQDRY